MSCAKCCRTIGRFSCYFFLGIYFIFVVVSFIAAFVFQYFYEPPSFRIDFNPDYCVDKIYSPVFGLEYKFSELSGIHVTPSEDNITLYWSACGTLESIFTNKSSGCYYSRACGVDQYNLTNKVSNRYSPDLYIPPERNTWVRFWLGSASCSPSTSWCNPSKDVEMYVTINCVRNLNKMVLVDSRKVNNTFDVEINSKMACSQYFGTFPEDSFHIGVYILPFVGLSSCLISFLLAKYRPPKTTTETHSNLELIDEASRILPITENIQPPRKYSYWLQIPSILFGVIMTSVGFLNVTYLNDQFYNSDNPYINLAARYISNDIVELQYIFSVFAEAGAIILLYIAMFYLFRKLLQFNGKAGEVIGVRKLIYKLPLKLVSSALTAIIMPYLSHRILIMITPAFKPDMFQLTMGGNSLIATLWFGALLAILIGIIRIGLVFDLTPGDVWEKYKQTETEKWDVSCWDCCMPSYSNSESKSDCYLLVYLLLSVKLLFKAFFGTVENVLVKKEKLHNSIFDFLQLRAATVAFLFVLFPVIGPYLYVMAYMFGNSGIWAREYWGKNGDLTPPWIRYFTCIIYSFIPFTVLIFPDGFPLLTTAITAISVFVLEHGTHLAFHIIFPFVM